MRNISFFKLFANGTILLSFILLLIIFYWLIAPYNPATFRRQPHVVEPKVVEGGTFLTINVDMCKHMDITPEISRVFVDGVIYQIPAYITVDDGLGCKIRKDRIYIPKGLPKGEYFISTTYRFRVNPVRTIEIQTRSDKFKVVE